MKPSDVKAILKKTRKVSDIFKSLSHPIRLQVLCLLMEEDRCVAELTEFCGISQPGMSQFLARMKQDGMIESRRQGKQVLYRIVDESLLKLLRAAKELYC